MTANLNILQHQLTDKRPQLRHLRDQRKNECQQAAKELSDCRINGLGKVLLGNVNCMIGLGMAFCMSPRATSTIAPATQWRMEFFGLGYW